MGKKNVLPYGFMTKNIGTIPQSNYQGYRWKGYINDEVNVMCLLSTAHLSPNVTDKIKGKIIK